MDMNGYMVEQLVGARLSELHAAALRHSLARAARRARPPLRVALGLALIRLGRWALGPAHRSLASHTS